jgi:hypothetical protein
LFYRLAGQVWRVGADGAPPQPVEVPDNFSAVPAPDGQRLLLVGPPTALRSLLDLRDGRKHVLDGGYASLPCALAWWPANPQRLLGLLMPPGGDSGYACRGSAALWGPDGKVQVLAQGSSSLGPPAGSPDGKQVAFDREGMPLLYDLEKGAQLFDVRRRGAPQLAGLPMVSPAWSPSGASLAWVVGVWAGGRLQGGVAVFDLAAQTARFYAPYDIWEFEGTYPRLAWGEDETRLAVVNPAHDVSLLLTMAAGETQVDRLDGQLSPDGRWIVQAAALPGEAGIQVNLLPLAGGEGHVLTARAAPGTAPAGGGVGLFWSPDGGQLIFGWRSAAGCGAYWLARSPDWQPLVLDLPSGACVAGLTDPALAPGS